MIRIALVKVRELIFEVVVTDEVRYTHDRAISDMLIYGTAQIPAVTADECAVRPYRPRLP